MTHDSSHLFVICPDPALLKYLVKKWNGKRTHFGLFPGAICPYHDTRIIVAQPIDESPMAYAAVRTLSHNFGKAPYLLAVPAISLTHQLYPADVALVSQAMHFPYPAEFSTQPPNDPNNQVKSVTAAQNPPPRLLSQLLNHLPQPEIRLAVAGHSTISTPSPSLWRRCRSRYNIDLISRSPFGFIDCLLDQHETGHALAYMTNSFHDNSAGEYLNRRHQTFEAIANAAQELIS